MKKNLFLTVALIAGMMLAGCSKDSENMEENNQQTIDTTPINKEWWLDARSEDKKNWKIVLTRWLNMTDDGRFEYLKPLMDVEVETGSYTRRNDLIDFIPDDVSFEIRSAEISNDTIIVKVEEKDGVFYLKGPDMALFGQ